jgi:hypothetical protein
VWSAVAMIGYIVNLPDQSVSYIMLKNRGPCGRLHFRSP